MRDLLRLAPLLLFVTACSSPPPKEKLPERETPVDRKVRPDQIVALFNGEPLTWQTIAEKMLELNLRESVDQYVRWRLVEDRREAMKIEHTPEELQKRAAASLDQVKKSLGEERFREQLAREGISEDAKRAQLQASPLLAQVLTLDKIVRFSAILEDQIEIDRVYFADEAAARDFRSVVTAKGFDAAAKELGPDRSAARGRFPREVFPKTQPPSDPVLDPWIVEALLKLSPGSVTEVEMSRSNLYYVVRLQGIRKARRVVYSEVREEVLDGILQDPPLQAEYLRWMERALGKCRIEYQDGASKREKGR